VQLGRQIDGDWEVLSGLRPGEQVVLRQATVERTPAP
jgi:multidrug efflux pump subunit AcrA (membrane-fusion protein)